MIRGPAPQPTALKLLKGNPGRRPLNDSEPKPKVKKPHCPAHLDEAARKEWKRLLPMLLRMRVLTEADYIAFANLCMSYSTMVQAQQQLTRTGLLLKTQSGYVQQSPLVGIVRSQMDIINRLCSEFGLTPSSRTRVQAAPDSDKPKSKWAAFKAASSNAA